MNKYKVTEDFEYMKSNDSFFPCLWYIVWLFAGAVVLFGLGTALQHRHIKSAIVNIEQKMLVEYTNTLGVSNSYIRLEKP